MWVGGGCLCVRAHWYRDGSILVLTVGSHSSYLLQAFLEARVQRGKQRAISTEILLILFLN